MADLEYTVEEGIGTILLNRPERRNAFTLEMIDEWTDVVRGAATDDDVQVLVLTGAGKSFCAGGDLDMLGEKHTSLSRKRHIFDRIQRIARAMDDLDKPTIAAVNGAAAGAGMDMALMCDMRIAARSARFAESYINVGLVPGDGGCFYLPRLVGPAKALELLLTGDFVDAEEAERLGIVNRVVDDDVLMDETRALAKRIAAKSPVPLRMIKRAVYQSLRTDLRTSLDLISSHFGVVAVTEDAEEAMAAFREKRDPVFKNR
jgi:enoyl-CoA hydratase/carnithine racemase